MRFIPLLFLLLLCTSVRAQKLDQVTEPGMYFVSFTDKEGSLYSLDEPATFLSAKALSRRASHNMEVTELDLPVSATYEAAIRGTGAKIWLRSKWMNGVVIRALPPQIKAIREMSFVSSATFVAPRQYDRESPVPVIPSLDAEAPNFDPVPVESRFYGYGWDNLDQMEGDSLHLWGFRGKDVLVAVFDGGFPNVGYKDFLGYYRDEQVPAGFDLVEQDSMVHDGGTHGATVLSTMAAHHPFIYVGTAPDARYVLFKTENGRGEHRLEEINYAIALEIADSIGVDVVNSSLGYSSFTLKSMDYSYEDMDGKTSPASVAIGHAFKRGMIIVTSAGNSGSDEWRYITVPADAPDVLSVGALEADGKRAYFSSYGPTADGRIKPDVAALGVNVAHITANGRGLSGSNGTSLASPLVAGLVACLRQAVPEATNQELLDAIRATADQADKPDGERGYGRPNFAAAYRMLMAARK